MFCGYRCQEVESLFLIGSNQRTFPPAVNKDSFHMSSLQLLRLHSPPTLSTLEAHNPDTEHAYLNPSWKIILLHFNSLPRPQIFKSSQTDTVFRDFAVSEYPENKVRFYFLTLPTTYSVGPSSRQQVFAMGLTSVIGTKSPVTHPGTSNIWRS